MSKEQIDELTQELEAYVGDIDSDDPRAKKRRRILDAAAELIARQGYRKTSMDEIARAAAVAKGTLYLYFDNKVQVALSVIAREKQKFFDRIVGVFDDARPAEERLRLWLTTILSAGAEMSIVSRLMERDHELLAILSDMPPALQKDVTRRRYEWLGPLVAEASGGRQWSDQELRDHVDSLCSLAFLSPLLRHHHVTGGLSAQRCATVLADVLVRGLQTHEENER